VDTKYLKDGEEVGIIAELGDGRFLVCDLYGDGVSFWADESNAYVVNKVFEDVPVLRQHKKVDELNEQINTLKKEIDSLEEHKFKLASMEDTIKKSIEDLKNKKKLHQELESVLAGEYKYTYNRHWNEIKELKDCANLYLSFEHKDGNFSLDWFVREDGHWAFDVGLCKTKEEAQELHKEYIIDTIKDINIEKDTFSRKIDLYKEAKKYNVIIPLWFKKEVERIVLEDKLNDMKVTEKKYKKAKKSYEDYLKLIADNKRLKT
jgi:hypothetical protein